MPDPTPTLTEIAAEIRKHAPGAMTPGLTIEDHYGIPTLHSFGVYLHGDIARHVLGFAMVMGGGISRFEEPHGWTAQIEEPESVTAEHFLDSDHGNDPLLSLYAAWRWARGIQ
jgi:hypothetical protein